MPSKAGHKLIKCNFSGILGIVNKVLFLIPNQ